MSAAAPRPAQDRWRDIEGTHLSLFCRYLEDNSRIAPMTAPDRPLTPGQALEKLFLDNADRGANAANDELVAALGHRARAIRALANLTTPPSPRPETTAQD